MKRMTKRSLISATTIVVMSSSMVFAQQTGMAIKTAMSGVFGMVAPSQGMQIVRFLNTPDADGHSLALNLTATAPGGLTGLAEEAAYQSGIRETIDRIANPNAPADRFLAAQKLESLRMLIGPALPDSLQVQLRSAVEEAQVKLTAEESLRLEVLMRRMAASLGLPTETDGAEGTTRVGERFGRVRKEARLQPAHLSGESRPDAKILPFPDLLSLSNPSRVNSAASSRPNDNVIIFPESASRSHPILANSAASSRSEADAKTSGPTDKEMRIGKALTGLAVLLPILIVQGAGFFFGYSHSPYFIATLAGGAVGTGALYGWSSWDWIRRHDKNASFGEKILSIAVDALPGFIFGAFFAAHFAADWAKNRLGPKTAAWLHRRSANRAGKTPQ